MNRLVKLRGTFSAAQVDGDLVMIDLESGRFFTLKDPALRIWNALDETDDLEAICATLTSEYAVAPSQCRRDVEAFARQLVDAGFAAYA